MLESAILYAFACWFGFYLLARAKITARPRAWFMRVSPQWAQDVVTCPICATFWAWVVVCITSGYTPMVWWVPPMVLFLDLLFVRLNPASESPGSQTLYP